MRPLNLDPVHSSHSVRVRLFVDEFAGELESIRYGERALPLIGLPVYWFLKAIIGIFLYFFEWQKRPESVDRFYNRYPGRRTAAQVTANVAYLGCGGVIVFLLVLAVLLAWLQ